MLSSDLKPLNSADADSSLYDAILRLQGNDSGHLSVIDADSRDVIYLLAYRRILHLIALLVGIFT